MLMGKHLIAGQWVGGDTTFTNEPVSGAADSFATGTPELVDQACQSAEEAFWSYGYSTRAERATFLRSIADEIDARGDEITAMGCKETGLPEARLIGDVLKLIQQSGLADSRLAPQQVYAPFVGLHTAVKRRFKRRKFICAAYNWVNLGRVGDCR